MDRNIIIFDTTLRDGEQCPGASMNLEEKFQVAQQLARLRVDVIEAGFPFSSPGDFEAVRFIGTHLDGPVIAGLSRARAEDIECTAEALKGAKRPRIHTVIATSDVHLKYKLHKTREEVLEQSVAAVKCAKRLVEDVEFSAEDASRTDMDYLCQIIEAVIEAGATTVNLPDTVGYAVPEEYGAMIRSVRERVPATDRIVLSVHCHDDLGMAVANSLEAARHGAGQIECTINGIGERAGNAALEEIVMALRTRRDFYRCGTGIDAREINRASRLVRDITGFAVQPNKAIVGRNAFAHASGIHQDGVLKEKQTYEIMLPEDVGWTEKSLILTSRSGRHAVRHLLQGMGYELDPVEMEKVYARFLELADKKKEVSDLDLEALVADETSSVSEEYHLDYMQVTSGVRQIPAAVIRILQGDRAITGAQTGVGPVDAVYKTIDSLLAVEHELVDFNVHSVTGGTEALGECTVKIGGDGQIFTGRASST
ncbi:MAG: 2-isopropylmalate synthase, partial [Armatimonadota bacterium]|nr:2-isopropylmalate synthase [Armatimonadota bacterium]